MDRDGVTFYKLVIFFVYVILSFLQKSVVQYNDKNKNNDFVINGMLIIKARY